VADDRRCDRRVAPGRAPQACRARRGRQALEQSLRETVRLGDGELGVEHLLLALLRDGDSRAVQCLERLRISPAMVEDEIGRMRLAAPDRGDQRIA